MGSFPRASVRMSASGESVEGEGISDEEGYEAPVLSEVRSPSGEVVAMIVPIEQYRVVAALQEELETLRQRDLAHKVWSMLVMRGQVEEDWAARLSFVTNWPGCREYRFCGDLGFGGKVWAGSPPYVTCYPEDKTPEREKTLASLNAALAALGDR